VETWRAKQECRVQKGITELHRTSDSAVNFGPGEEAPQLGNRAAQPAGRRQWAEHRLEAVRKGQMGQTGVTDFDPEWK